MIGRRSLIATAAIAACQGPISRPPSGPAPIHTGNEPAEQEAVASGWRYHPRDWSIRDGMRLEDGRWLLVGDRGERWQSEPIESKSKARRADAILGSAPEMLRHVVRWSSARWLFVGDSGAIYTAADPTGPLSELAPSPGPLHGFAGRDGVLVAVNPFGSVLRFDGARWQSVATRAPIFQVAADGAALLGLSYPEQLWSSNDGGSNWSPLDVARAGAYALRETHDSGVRIRGVGGARIWRDGKLDLDRPDAEVVLPIEHGQLTPRRGPNAEAIAEGRAAIAGMRYHEIESRQVDCDGCSDDGALWLLSGRLDSQLEEQIVTLPSRASCGAPKLAAHGKHLALACPSDGRVAVFSSDDGGNAWHERASLTTSKAGRLEIAVGPTGTILISGACDQQGCNRIVRAPVGQATIGIATPQLVGAAARLVWRGERPFFVGSTAKGGYAPFAGENDGASFEAVAVDAKSNKLAWFAKRWRSEGSIDERAVLPGNDDAIGLFLAGPTPAYAVADGRGTLQQLANFSRIGNVQAIGAAGRALLVAALDRETGSQLSLWQSLDGGVSIREVGAPFALGSDIAEGLHIACAEIGCIMGDRATRIGWHEDAADRGRRRVERTLRQTAVRTPLGCTLGAKGWMTLHAAKDGELPQADDAFRGTTAWALLSEADDGAVIAWSGDARSDQAHDGLRRDVLFEKGPRASFAIRNDPQAEGFVALRAPVSQRTAKELRVAWIDYYGGQVVRATIGGLSLDKQTISLGERPFLIAGTSSMTLRGAIVKPTVTEDSYFIDMSGRVRGPAASPSLPGGELTAVNSALVLDDPFHVTVFLDDAQAIRAASLTPFLGGSRTDASFAPESGSRRQVGSHWSYGGDHAGVVVNVVQRDLARAAAYFVPFDAASGIGEPSAVPTQLDAVEPYRPCTPEERRGTPRVIAPMLMGTRHPIAIAGEPEPMMTSEAILHGTRDKPCVAGWVADPPRRGGRRAFISADPQRAWLMRVARAEANAIEVAAMRCAFDPKAPVPEWIASFACTERTP